MRDWASALELDPEFVEVFSNRAGLYARQGQFDLALRDAQRTVELNDQWPTGILTLAHVLHDLTRHEEALAQVHRALVLEPTNIQGLILRGMILMALKRHQEALASYEQVLTQEGLSGEQLLQVYAQLLPCLMRVGEDSAAYARIDEIITPETAGFLARYFLQIGEPLLALRALTHGDPEDDDVKQLLDEVDERIIEMSDAGDSRVIQYKSYHFWCSDPEKMVEELAEELQGKVTTAELRLTLEILGEGTRDTEPDIPLLLRDAAFREAFERVVLPRTSPARKRQLLGRLLTLERGA